jgi:hypothetical protein
LFSKIFENVTNHKGLLRLTDENNLKTKHSPGSNKPKVFEMMTSMVGGFLSNVLSRATNSREILVVSL